MNGVQLLPKEHLSDFIAICGDAYPALDLALPETKEKTIERLSKRMESDSINFYGYYRDGQLLGGMILYDFLMNFRSVQLPAGGVGMVAVDFLHKKEKVAKELIGYFLNHYRERGISMTLLYPFRPDFYKKMGFGFGTKNNQYKILPSSFPSNGQKAHLVYLNKDDEQQVRDCYNRMFAKTHGMIQKTELELAAIFGTSENRIIGYRQGDELLGYMVFTFRKEHEQNFLLNNLLVKELIYETPAVLAEFSTFLNSQSDQIERVVIHTQDEYLHHLLADPRNGEAALIPPVSHQTNIAATGIMYRVVDQARLWSNLSALQFGEVNCQLKITLQDSFLPANSNSQVVHFQAGIPVLCGDSEEYEAEIQLGVSEFSSLVMGVVPFSQLVRYGLAQVSDEAYVEKVTRIFHTVTKPICTTPF